MALINLTLQGKGGVGKSFVASLLAQYYQSRGGDLACYDTDPVNQSFGGYTAFGVERVQPIAVATVSMLLICRSPGRGCAASSALQPAGRRWLPSPQSIRRCSCFHTILR
ncbi:MAG: hypothetical protein WCZ23_17190 [Rhodospirillaceae bacterium]